MKPSVYIETTIVSYLTAWPSRNVLRLSHERITREWWKSRRKAFDLVASDFVVGEASRGDPIAAKERLEKLIEIPLLPITTMVGELTERLIKAMALPKRARADGSHVAIAAIYGIDYLLTWNCRHLANAMLADRIEATCQAAGLKAPRIITPELLMDA